MSSPWAPPGKSSLFRFLTTPLSSHLPRTLAYYPARSVYTHFCGVSESGVSTPYSIGKELSTWVEKLFETSIPAKTLEKRAQRVEEKIKTNVSTPPTTKNHSEIQENQVSEHGGARKGAGRAPKNAKPKTPAPPPEPYTDAVYLADIAISPLEKRFLGLKFFGREGIGGGLFLTAIKTFFGKNFRTTHILQRGGTTSCPEVWVSGPKIR